MGKQTAKDATLSSDDPPGAAKTNEGTAGTPHAEDATNDSKAVNPGNRESSRWYGGSWRGKATAVSGVARETVPPSTDSGGEPTTTSKAPISTQRRSSKDLLTPKRPTSVAASMTKLNVSSNGAIDETADAPSERVSEERKRASTTTDPKTDTTKERTLPASGWRGWWAKSPVTGSDMDEKVQERESENTTKSRQVADQPPEIARPDAVDRSGTIPDGSDQPSVNAEVKNDDPVMSKQQSSRSSWFGLWGSTGAEASPTRTTRAKSLPAEPEISQSDPVKSASETTAVENTGNDTGNSTEKPDRPISGSWAFWSRERPRSSTPASTSAGRSTEETGEVAVENTQSSDNPQPAKVTRTSEDASASKRRGRPVSSDTVKITAKRKATVSKTEPNTEGSPQPEMYRSSDVPDMARSILRTTIEKPHPKSADQAPRRNLVLPELRDVYHVVESPSYWQQLTRIFGRASSTPNYVSISPTPFKPRRAIAIGVHGFFPAALIQKVIGPPTGTSLRFANEAASAIERWCYSHSIDCDIEKVALEGEGTIFARLETLWKLLLNWVDALRKADLIFFAAHSQGVPVAVMLISKLISFGCLKPDARVGICAMAGVNTGPFTSYQTRLLGAAANELFAFSKPESDVSMQYIDALRHCLSSGVRTLYIGSIDDQLVPLDSATFVPLTHAYIFRAVFVDGRLHAPDFLVRLVGFVMKLRNLGIADHGLLRELSSPLAGSLYTGEGHSRIYEDDGVYDLALEVTLETTTLPTLQPLDTNTLQRTRNAAANQSQQAASSEAPHPTTNPYFLPWAMRGVLEEDYVRTGLRDETAELLNLFESWRPTSKVLKDVKFRLEAVKSKL